MLKHNTLNKKKERFNKPLAKKQKQDYFSLA
jgi:hypothetical protein